MTDAAPVFQVGRTAGAIRRQRRVEAVTSPETLDAAGIERPVSWRQPAGASEVRVDIALLRIHPTVAGPGRNVGEVSAKHTGVTQVMVAVPGGRGRIRALHLDGLKDAAGASLRSSSELGTSRLVVAPVRNGQVQAPLVAVPPIPAVNALPAQLTGGSFSNGVLGLPDIDAATVRLTLVNGGTPADFVPQSFSLDRVSLWVAPYPGEVAVSDGTGAQQWAAPGLLTANVDIDLKAAIERNLTAALPDGPLATRARISAASPGSAVVELAVSGAVIRGGDERASVDVTGTARGLPLGGAPLDLRTPVSVTADVGVIHHGTGIHPASDPVPVSVGGLTGALVTDRPVIRPLPPEALVGSEVRCLAVVGWAAGPTDLSIGLVRIQGDVAVGPVGEHPGVAVGLDRTAGATPPSVVWVELPAPLEPGAGVGVSVTATRGAFRWVSAPQPLVLVGVTTAPEGRQVRLGARRIDLTGPETVITGASLPVADFAGRPPVVASDQFVTVNVSKLRLEYAP